MADDIYPDIGQVMYIIIWLTSKPSTLPFTAMPSLYPNLQLYTSLSVISRLVMGMDGCVP